MGLQRVSLIQINEANQAGKSQLSQSYQRFMSNYTGEELETKENCYIQVDTVTLRLHNIWRGKKGGDIK